MVIDTNIFVSSFFGGNPEKIISLWKNGKIILCLSKEIIEEYAEVLSRFGLKHQRELKELLNLFSKRFNMFFISSTPTIKIIKSDPSDNKFIKCAVSCNVNFIITGDMHLKILKQYKNIKIINPENFMAVFNRQTL
ncbi:MAG: putative toxin-antitoxin system toxin component, PIN family [Candidatus Omnitrophica bacterium]|nr:putative toxin-antitoxin system toxin component, PIN family [Candidatus Omnitrophota bacterium]